MALEDPTPPPRTEPAPEAAAASTNLMNQQLGLIAAQLGQIEAHVKHSGDAAILTTVVVAAGMGACTYIIWKLAGEVTP